MSKPRPRETALSGDENLAFLIYSLPVILGGLCYINSLSGDFVHDDVFAIQRNNDVTGQGSLLEVFKNDFWGRRMADANSHKSYRPLCVLSFRWNYEWGGGDPRPFHVVNLLLHLCVTCVVTHVCLHVLHTSQLCTLSAASLFAVHPIHTEAVTGIVGRADLLASLGVLVAFYLYARCIPHTSQTLQPNLKSYVGSARDINDNRIPATSGAKMSSGVPSSGQTAWLVASLGVTAAATLCKETGITALGVCLLYDLLLHRRQLFRVRQEKLMSPTVKCLAQRCGTLTLAGVFILAFRLWLNNFQQPKFLQEDNPASFSPHLMTRALSYSYLATFNLGLLLYPSVLSYDWQGASIPLIESTLDPRNMITLLVGLVGVWVGLRLWRDLWLEDPDDLKAQPTKEISPPPHVAQSPSLATGHSDLRPVPTPVMALVLLCVPFVPASNLCLRVGFVVAERILYLPSLGICLLVAHGLCCLYARYPAIKSQLLTAFVLLLLTMGARTYLRNQDWRSRHALFWSGVQTLPHNAKVHYNLANYLRDVKDLAGAEEHYRVAIRLNPAHPSYYNNLGTLLTNQSEAEELFRTALNLRPDHKLAMLNMGNLLLEQGNQSGVTFLHQALEVDPTYVDALLSLGKALLDSGQLDQAERYLRHAKDLRPDLPDVHTYYGALFQKSGQYENALNEFQHAFALNSNHLATVKSAVTSLRHLKRYPEAERLLQQAISVASDSSDMYSQLGLLYSDMGQNVDALVAYKRSLALSPNDTLTNLRYLKVLEATHQYTEVRRGLQELLHKVPTSVDVLHFAFIFAQRQNRPHEAMHYLQEVTVHAKAQGHPKLPVFYHDLGNLHREAEDMEKAQQCFELSLQYNPSYLGSYINLGAVYHLKEEYEKAEANYLKALEIEPQNKLCQRNLQKLRQVWKKPQKSEKAKIKT